MKTLKMFGLLIAGTILCIFVVCFITLPSVFIILGTSAAINRGIIPNTTSLEYIIELIAMIMPFPMAILIQKIWLKLDPFFDKFDKFDE